MVSNPISVLHHHARETTPTYWYRFGGVRRVLVTTEPTVFRHVLKTNHRAYHKSDVQTKSMVEFLGEGLLTDPFEIWRPKRQLLQKGFHVTRLDQLSRGMHRTMQECLASFAQRAANGPVAMRPEFTRMTFGMTARSFFGMNVPLADIHRISTAISKVQEFMVRQVVRPYLRPWYLASGTVARYQAMRHEADAILMRQIEARLRDGPSDEEDLLDILLDMLDPDAPHPMTLPQILAESMQLLVAGHETSSNALSWILLLLERHPEHRAAIVEEFRAVLGDTPPVFSDVRRLPRTDAVIEEALRLFPPFWMVDRLALEDDGVGGLSIPKGTTVICFIYGLHRNPAFWENPDDFRPERFDGSLSQHKAFEHTPFGAGPRGCIGINYAKIQIMIVLFHLLREYDLTLEDGADLTLQPKFILEPRSELVASVELRR